ncbi:hypothetical protein KHQ81_15840 (plasmid) [Mycoplasmatota bacterium]|nr:hypothetical protein KHQ81_15840 [Mycoplasmatota bacterium]
MIFPNNLELNEYTFLIKISKNNYNEIIDVINKQINLKMLSYKYKVRFIKYIKGDNIEKKMK